MGNHGAVPQRKYTACRVHGCGVTGQTLIGFRGLGFPRMAAIDGCEAAVFPFLFNMDPSSVVAANAAIPCGITKH
jgi:hypothetical protein